MLSKLTMAVKSFNSRADISARPVLYHTWVLTPLLKDHGQKERKEKRRKVREEREQWQAKAK
jgi:hypothetical protein